jgi:hypothetical protein
MRGMDDGWSEKYRKEREAREAERRDADRRRWESAARIRAFDAAVEREAERQREFEADRRRRRARSANFAMEHPELCSPQPKPTTTASKSSSRASRSGTSPPWGVRELFPRGGGQWHRVPSGSRADAEKLAASLKRDGRQVEAAPMGGSSLRAISRIYDGPDAVGLR